jgi:hypothetical protein
VVVRHRSLCLISRLTWDSMPSRIRLKSATAPFFSVTLSAAVLSGIGVLLSKGALPFLHFVSCVPCANAAVSSLRSATHEPRQGKRICAESNAAVMGVSARSVTVVKRKEEFCVGGPHYTNENLVSLRSKQLLFRCILCTWV